MLNKSVNRRIKAKRAEGMLGWFQIPKNDRHKVLDIMQEKKLLKRCNRGNITIINPKKSNKVNKNTYEVLWDAIVDL